MMEADALRQAQRPVVGGLREMENTLRTIRDEITEVLGDQGGEMVAASGKRLRATLLLLSAGAGGSNDGPAPTVAAVVELIHLATLIHDDSIDDSTLRRGRPTAHVTWNHKIATMLGDLLYSRAFELLTQLGDLRLSREMARATRIMSRGELEEFLLRGTLPEESAYLRVVWAKTASFFGACCRAGAILGGAPSAHQELLARFGEKVGEAFQVTDDILDYTASDHAMGKHMGMDLRDGIVTLPLIAALARAGSEREALLSKVQQARDGQDVVDDVIATVRRLGGLDHAFLTADRLSQEALTILAELPAGPTIRSLDLVARYVVQRER
ncbi:MAG: polyprenyl synthetase family protein [Candidatus Eisenbacteria bacterium]|jgi:octaprenyl-diphosphate synthase|nr:polyprenyl synthetase family protein [Candidatus Eisenbacteria bacterium]